MIQINKAKLQLKKGLVLKTYKSEATFVDRENFNAVDHDATSSKLSLGGDKLDQAITWQLHFHHPPPPLQAPILRSKVIQKHSL